MIGIAQKHPFLSFDIAVDQGSLGPYSTIDAFIRPKASHVENELCTGFSLDRQTDETGHVTPAVYNLYIASSGNMERRSLAGSDIGCSRQWSETRKATLLNMPIYACILEPVLECFHILSVRERLVRLKTENRHGMTLSSQTQNILQDLTLTQGIKQSCECDVKTIGQNAGFLC